MDVILTLYQILYADIYLEKACTRQIPELSLTNI